MGPRLAPVCTALLLCRPRGSLLTCLPWSLSTLLPLLGSARLSLFREPFSDDDGEDGDENDGEEGDKDDGEDDSDEDSGEDGGDKDGGEDGGEDDGGEDDGGEDGGDEDGTVISIMHSPSAILFNSLIFTVCLLNILLPSKQKQ